MSTFSRAARVADEVRVALSTAIVREASDPALSLANITAVDLSNDLRHARVYWTALTVDSEARTIRDVERAFGRASGFLRRYLAENVALRHVPELVFQHDVSGDRGRRIDAILSDLEIPEDEEANG